MVGARKKAQKAARKAVVEPDTGPSSSRDEGDQLSDSKRSQTKDDASQLQCDQRELEDILVQKTRGKEFKLHDNSVVLVPGRRSYGTAAEKHITLKTNYLNITPLARDIKLHQYTVTFRNGQGEPSKTYKRRAMKALLRLPIFATLVGASDYSSVVITNGLLPLAHETDNTWTDRMPVIPPNTQPAGAQAPLDELYTGDLDFTVRHERELSLHQMIASLSSSDISVLYADGPNLVQALNIIIAKAPRSDPTLAVVGQNKFFPLPRPHMQDSPAESKDLGGGLVALRGFFSSVRPVVGRLLININVTSSAFYKVTAFASLVSEFRQFHRSTALAQTIQFCKGVRVLVQYTPRKGASSNQTVRRERTVFSLPQQNADQIQFAWKEGDAAAIKVTITEYYARKYGITLHDKKVINVRSAGNPEYIPVQFCTVVEGQIYRRLLTGDHTKAMVLFASRRPNQNAISIAGVSESREGAQGLRVLNLISQPSLPLNPGPQVNGVNRFGFEVGTEFLQVPGRILRTPLVSYANASSVMPRLASWNLIGDGRPDSRFHNCPRINAWGVLIFDLEEKDCQISVERVQHTMLAFQRLMGRCGMQAARPAFITARRLQALTPENKDVNQDIVFDALRGARVEILLVVLAKQDRWLYARMKYYADTQLGIHTICCIGNNKKLFRPKQQDSYLANLALKVNIKNGGTNHRVVDLWPRQLDKANGPTMLVGIDVTHPSPGSAPDAPSIAAMVASIDHDLTQWPGSLGLRKSREEIATPNQELNVKELSLDESKHKFQDLGSMLEARLDRWLDHCRKRKQPAILPRNLIVFRDGVSEGQYHLLLENELPVLKRACQNVYGRLKQTPPTFTVVVVGKRHHTRFFPMREEDSVPANQNPRPGTIVDRGIVHKILFEYWLQAHNGLQGTARPAHYVVLKDDIGFSADELQGFTHKLCYLFNRATKAVSICPPAYYADLLADRARLYLHDTMNEGTTSTAFTGPGGANMIHPNLAGSTFYI